MNSYTEQILKDIQQIQKEVIDAEELFHPETIEQISIKKLIRPSYSQRIHIPNLVRPLVLSLHELGFVGGIIINKNFNIVDGWHRTQIWKELGNTEIPCIILDVTPEQERKLHLSLNRHTAQFDIKEFGFTEEFTGINLIEDYGFSKIDFLLDDTSTPTAPELNRKSDAQLKLMLPEAYHKKLDNIKKDMSVRNKSEAVMKLIDSWK